ncbi:MAG TPA: sulfatase/phosphatase domain-containing protein, partial [Chloroflexota bacterium]|nr:sulfatase/phosphatase domain-containing protein [Chloroflexota bacterium]
VPLVMRLPPEYGPSPSRVSTAVSLVDVLPSLLDVAGLAIPPGLPGRSLLATAREEAAAGPGERTVFAEYHSQGMLDAGFMVRRGAWKYCHYAGHRPQLFNTAVDPQERHDLAGEASSAPLLAAFEGALRAVCDPERVDAAAKADQARRAGGVGRRRLAAVRELGHNNSP